MSNTQFTQQVKAFQEAYQSLINIAEGYPPKLQMQAGASGDWSARDALAQINGWVVEAHRRYPRFAKGTGNIEYNHDAFNAVSVWLRDDKNFEQILDETRQLIQKTITMATDLPDAYIEREDRYALWLKTLTEEAENHSQQLHKFLEMNT